MPDVSVLIAATGDRTGLGRALASVRRLAGRWEIETIVVDDALLPPLTFGDSPETPTVLRQQLRLGRSAAWNRGIASATGHYVAMLDDHTWWEPNFISSVLADMKAQDARWGFASSRQLRTVISPKAFAVRRCADFGSEQACGAISSLVSERELLWQVGGLASSYGALAGWELSLRLARAARGSRTAEALVGVSPDAARWPLRDVLRERRELLDKYGADLSSRPFAPRPR